MRCGRAAVTCGMATKIVVRHPRRQPNMHGTGKEPWGWRQDIPWNSPCMAAWKVRRAGGRLHPVLKPAEQTPITRCVAARRWGGTRRRGQRGDGMRRDRPLWWTTSVEDAFTGSTPRARIGQSRKALKRAMELGGESPTSCCRRRPGGRDRAPSDLLKHGQAATPLAAVHRRTVRPVVRRWPKPPARQKVGPGLPRHQLGRSCRRQHRASRVHEKGKAEGAELVAAATAPRTATAILVEPTFFTDPDDDLTIDREEIFGTGARAMPTTT